MHSNTAATTHYPRPAIVPPEPEHAWQRRFGAVATGSNYCPPLNIKNPAPSTEIEVFRSAHDDFARVDVQIGHPSLVNLWLRLTPADLRDMAARLIDAAHDIEAFPAASLAEAAFEGGVA